MTTSAKSTPPLALVVGATGMTGRFVVQQLLEKGYLVRIIARSPEKLSQEIRENPNLKVTHASVLDLSDSEMQEHTKGCEAILLCLGHTISVGGIWGSPRDLVTAAVKRLFAAAESNASPFKFVLMNSVGVRNPALNEQRTWSERMLLSTLRWTVPPHADNENAAWFLHQLGSSSQYGQWVVVRPDTLIDASEPYSYDVVESPTTGIVSGRDTARVNVAHFMVDLIRNEELWCKWVFQMPVIMDTVRSAASQTDAGSGDEQTDS